MPRRIDHVPFEGDAPQTVAGTAVECRNAWNDWVPMVATGPARYDAPNSVGGRCYLTVPVAVRGEWKRHGARATVTNWPAGDVRIP